MAKYMESTAETDEWAYGDKGANTVGWFICAPPSRHKAVASFLGVPGVYCVGIDRVNGRTFVQLGRGVDPRNGKLLYVEVLPEHVAEVKRMMESDLSPEEQRETQAHLECQMDMARLGVL